MFARRIFCWSTCDVFSFCLCALLIVTVVSITQSDRPKIVSFDEHQALLIRVGFKNTCDQLAIFYSISFFNVHRSTINSPEIVLILETHF